MDPMYALTIFPVVAVVGVIFVAIATAKNTTTKFSRNQAPPSDLSQMAPQSSYRYHPHPDRDWET